MIYDERHNLTLLDETLIVSEIVSRANEKGITIKALCRRAGADYRAFNYCMKNATIPHFDTAIALLRALDFDYIDIRKPQPPTT